MLRYSFIVMERVSSFPSPEALRKALQTLCDSGYEGVELNLTEPLGVELDVLERWTREMHLRIPSFLTGEAYFDGLCLSSPDGEIRRGAVERLIRYLDVAGRFDSILVVGLLQGLRRDEPDRRSPIAGFKKACAGSWKRLKRGGSMSCSSRSIISRSDSTTRWRKSETWSLPSVRRVCAP